MSLIKEYKAKNKSLQEKYGDKSVVLMMVGSFYEIYSDDFNNVSQITNILNILLTRKNKKKPVGGSNPYMCGFPCHSLSRNVSKLLSNNYTVAIYDQFEENGTISRQQINILSPSTYIDEEITPNNQLCCILLEEYVCPMLHKKIYSGYFSLIDLSTGRNKIAEYYDSADNIELVRNELLKNLINYNPCEVLLISADCPLKTEIVKECNGKMLHHRITPKEYTDVNYQISFLEKIFGTDKFVNIIEKLGLDKYGTLLVCYLHLLQFAYEHDIHIVEQIQQPVFIYNDSEMHMNTDCFFELNLFDSREKSSLFSVSNYTCTAMGKRLLIDRLTHPLIDTSILNARYELIEKCFEHFELYRKKLRDISDLEKKYRKIVTQKISPKELALLNNSYKAVLWFLEHDTLFAVINSHDKKFKKFYDDYITTFNLSEMANADVSFEKTFIHPGIHEKLDICNSKVENIDSIFEQVSNNLTELGEGKAQVKICDVNEEISFTTTKRCWEHISKKTFKFRIDYKHSPKPLVCVLSDFVIIKKNQNVVKVSSDLIKKLYQIRKTNVEKVQKYTNKIFTKKMKKYKEVWGETFIWVNKYISEIDFTTNAAYIAQKYAYHKPEIRKSDSSFIEAKLLRHPIIERIHDNEFYTPNDVSLGKKKTGMLLYGLNSSGKSSLLRSIGCNTILAQAGMYTASEKFIYSPFKKILTKISSSDNIFKGQSTFIAEMQELKNILTNCDSNTLVLCDELTAGTETNSATGIVAGAISCLLEMKVPFLFTTHLHGITKFSEIVEDKTLQISHFKILFKNGDFLYDRKLRDGSGDDIYGIEIANAMGLDKNFIKKAFYFRQKHLGRDTTLLQNKKSRYNSKVFVDRCSLCGKQDRLDTHHIHHQKDADTNNIILHFPKNIKHNLLVVCKSCHQKIHHHE